LVSTCFTSMQPTTELHNVSHITTYLKNIRSISWQPQSQSQLYCIIAHACLNACSHVQYLFTCHSLQHFMDVWTLPLMLVLMLPLTCTLPSTKICFYSFHNRPREELQLVTQVWGMSRWCGTLRTEALVDHWKGDYLRDFSSSNSVTSFQMLQLRFSSGGSESFCMSCCRKGWAATVLMS